MEQRKGKRQLNQGVRVKRTEEKEKRADRSAERTREATAVRAKRTTETRAARGAETSLGQKLKAIHGKVRKAVHESRERNFPESNGVAGQLLLLLCGKFRIISALSEYKCVVNYSYGAVGVLCVYKHRNLNFACGYHADVYAGVIKRLEHF